MATLDNHNDTSEIYVLQLDGAKKWLVCKGSQLVKKNMSSRFATTIWKWTALTVIGKIYAASF
jgi:ribosomal protein L16 Arg81 hydroxylase